MRYFPAAYHYRWTVTQLCGLPCHMVFIDKNMELSTEGVVEGYITLKKYGGNVIKEMTMNGKRLLLIEQKVTGVIFAQDTKLIK